MSPHSLPAESIASLAWLGSSCHAPCSIMKLHLYRWHTHTPTHTHTPRNSGADDMTMKVRWTWKWDEKLLNQDAKRGTQKKRERANTSTNTPGPERANPERAREEKPEADRNGTRPAEEGRTEAPEPTYHGETYKPTSARAGPNLPEDRKEHMR